MRRPSVLTVAQWTTIFIPVAIIAGRAVADVAVICVALLFVIHSVKSRSWQWLQVRWVQLLLLLWAYLVINGLFAVDPMRASTHALAFIRYVLFAAALAFWVLNDDIIRQRLLYSLAAMIAFLTADGWLQYSTGSDLFGRQPFPPPENPRLTGPFSKPHLGIMLSWLLFPVIITLSMHQRYTGWVRAATIVVGICAVALIFATGERMALLLTLFGAGLWGVCVLRTALRGVIIVTIMLALSIGGLAMFKPAMVERQIHSTHHVIKHLWDSPYGMIWQSSFAMITENPITGIGNRMFRIYCPDATYGATDKHTLELRCNLHPHNFYLELLVNGGAIALLLFIAAFFYIIRPLFGHWRHLTSHPLLLGLTITLILRLWPVSATPSFFISWSAVPFWLIVGWWIAEIKMLESKKQNG